MSTNTTPGRSAAAAFAARSCRASPSDFAGSGWLAVPTQITVRPSWPSRSIICPARRWYSATHSSSLVSGITDDHRAVVVLQPDEVVAAERRDHDVGIGLRQAAPRAWRTSRACSAGPGRCSSGSRSRSPRCPSRRASPRAADPTARRSCHRRRGRRRGSRRSADRAARSSVGQSSAGPSSAQPSSWRDRRRRATVGSVCGATASVVSLTVVGGGAAATVVSGDADSASPPPSAPATRTAPNPASTTTPSTVARRTR